MRLAKLVHPCPRPVERLVSNGLEIRDSRLYYWFSIPSRETTPGGVYELLVDAETLETDCDCHWHKGKRRTHAGTEKYGPVDLMRPKGLCHHLNRVSAWLRRYRKAVLETQESAKEVNRLLREQAREVA